MIIAISGSQGSGKSTLLQELEKRGFPTVQRKTSRSILTDWNITLDQVNSDPDLCVQFQMEITQRKINDEREAILSKDIWFTERTHTDLFVYALMNLGKFNKYEQWLNDYYNVCADSNKQYSKIFYIPGGMFNIENDGIRGSNRHYGTMIDVTMKTFLEQMTPLTNEIKYVNMINIEQRVDYVLQHIVQK